MEEKVLRRIEQLMPGQSAAARHEVELTNLPVVVAQAERFRQRRGYWEARLSELDGEDSIQSKNVGDLAAGNASGPNAEKQKTKDVVRGRGSAVVRTTSRSGGQKTQVVRTTWQSRGDPTTAAGTRIHACRNRIRLEGLEWGP